MTRRSKMEIYLDILRIINDGTSKPTRIMYGANISWNPLQQMLRSMISGGIIRENDTRNMQKYDMRTNKRYEITEKGINAIKYFKRAEEFFEGIQVKKRARRAR